MTKLKNEDQLAVFGMRIPQGLPEPTGYKLLLMPLVPPKQTQGGIFLPDQTHDAEKYGAMCAYVLAVGPDAYTGEKFRSAWCEVGDFVMLGKYAGSKFTVDDVDVRILNDDEIIAKVPDPSKIKRFIV